MKKATALFAAVVLAFVLCACGTGLCFDEGPKIQFAKENAELLERCVDTIRSDCLSNDWNLVLIYPENGKVFMCRNSSDDRASTKTEIQSSDLSELFGTGQVKHILVQRLNGPLDNIKFMMDCIGMGSTSSANIVYFPSDEVENIYPITSQMHFFDFREGKMGEIDGDDNYLYYVRISPCWYYIERGD